jgi:RimJ/RimL family protein N-acetyltransferase
VDPTFDHLLTARLVLRRFTAEDADSLARYRSIPEVARFQGWDAPFAVDRAHAMIGWLVEHDPDEPGEWYQLAIALRDDPGRLVGDCGFRPRADEPLVVDIGFTLDPSFQGRGLATEAVGELLRYLFEDRAKHKVCADCDTRNEASWRLMERLGLAREGSLRESFCDDGDWADEYLYGILASDWRARREVTRDTLPRSPGGGDATLR